jgi:oligo-1,6-glucosidase
VLHLHRGTPYVYQGEELGMTNAPFTSIADFRDIESVNHYADAVAVGAEPAQVLAALRAMSRDNARTPMQWDDSPHSGFTSGTPWIPVNPNYTSACGGPVNAAAAQADPDSVFHHYRKLIELRHTEPVVVVGEFVMLLPDSEDVYAYLRLLGDVEMLVLGNFSGADVHADVPDAASWASAELVLGNYGSDGDAGGDAAEDPRGSAGARGIPLRPWETRVYRRVVGA